MLTKYRVTLEVQRKPHKGRLFSYVVETLGPGEAIELAKQYAWDFDRVTSTKLAKIEEVSHVAA